MVNSFCLLDQSKFGPGDAMLAGISGLHLGNSFERFPRHHSSIAQAICSPHLWGWLFPPAVQLRGADQTAYPLSLVRDTIHIA
jgi:hypothetical protein